MVINFVRISNLKKRKSSQKRTTFSFLIQVIDFLYALKLHQQIHGTKDVGDLVLI